MLHASIRMRFAHDQLAEVREILSAMVERTRVKPGCVGCDLYQDLLDPDVLLFEEWWEDEDKLHRHLRSEPYRYIILVMEMATEFPVVRFSEIKNTSGIETVKNSRWGLPEA